MYNVFHGLEECFNPILCIESYLKTLCIVLSVPNLRFELMKTRLISLQIRIAVLLTYEGHISGLKFTFLDYVRFFLGSNKVMQVSLGRSVADEIRPDLHKISKVGMPF